jgi:hypothetical protein
LDLPGSWGDGTYAAADGCQIDTWSDNLLAESRIRLPHEQAVPRLPRTRARDAHHRAAALSVRRALRDSIAVITNRMESFNNFCQWLSFGSDVLADNDPVHAAGEHSIADLAEMFSVSRPIVYRVLERAAAAREGPATVTSSG